MIKREQQEVEGLENATDELKCAIQGKQSLLEQGLINLSIGSKNKDLIKLSIETPEGLQRVPNDIVCVLDISGSMATEAHVKNSEGVKERHGLSYLDLLKHATKTIVHCLHNEDRFALVSYSDEGRVEFSLSGMTEENKQTACLAIDNLSDEGCTNIWGGVQKGLELLRTNEDEQTKGNHKSLLLLTDGEPNIFPPSGLVNTLKHYKETYKDFYFNMNTFAFGKRIDTPLLDEYAYIGNGQYSFIPCPGFIGTIFVNSISNILNTMGSRAVISLELLNKVRFNSLLGEGIPYKKKGNKVEIHVGDLKFGQTRDIVFNLNIPDNVMQELAPIMNIELKYFDHVGKKTRIGSVQQEPVKDWNDPFVDAHYCRCLFVDEVREALTFFKMGQIEQSQNKIVNLAAKFKGILKELEDWEYEVSTQQDQKNEEFLMNRLEWSQNFIKNLLKDVEGEVTLALKHQGAYDHWGKHFLPSLSHAHLKQQCNNFCDPGIQHYGGELFKKIKQECEDTFLKLPAPKPSKKAQQRQHYYQPKPQQNQPQQQQQQQQQQQAKQQQQKQEDDAAIDMAQYYDCGGGCMAGDCLVSLSDGSQIALKNLQKGDNILGKDNSISTVQAIVKINNNNNQKYLQMARFENGLVITPKHPIYYQNQWVKPQNLRQIQYVEIDCVYNLVLDSNHSALINGIPCITLGHQLKDKQAYHKYFGSKQVIEDLKKVDCRGFEDGLVEIDMQSFVRDEKTKSVIGVQKTQQTLQQI